MMTNIFVPKNGAIVDLIGLDAVSDTSNRLLSVYLSTKWPTVSNIVLSGLELDGKRPRKNGPPGVMQFSPSRFTISSGIAILATDDKRRHLVTFEEPEVVSLEEPNKADQLRTIVLTLLSKRGLGEESEELAHNKIYPLIKLVNKIDVDLDTELPLANELAPKIWSTDVRRLFQPEHVDIQGICTHLDELEETIWTSDRHGLPWKNQRMGREWKSYQTKASVAVTAARITLSGRPSTTADRARCLTNLHWQLQRSVEEAAKGLEKWMGVAEAADAYSSVFSAFPQDWDEM
jgi:hypothetical protein